MLLKWWRKELFIKKVLYLILENGNEAISVFDSIRQAGYNGTLMRTASLRHALDDDQPEDTHFFSLTQYEHFHDHGEAMFALFVVDEEKLEGLKAMIRVKTDNFEKLAGGMFSRSLEDYEGSF